MSVYYCKARCTLRETASKDRCRACVSKNTPRVFFRFHPYCEARCNNDAHDENRVHHCATFRVVLTRFCNSQSHVHQARCNSQRRVHKAKCNSIQIHVSIYTCIHIHTNLNTYMHTHIYMSEYIHAYTYIHTHIQHVHMLRVECITSLTVVFIKLYATFTVMCIISLQTCHTMFAEICYGSRIDQIIGLFCKRVL